MGSLALLAVVAAARIYGSFRWSAGTRELRERLERARAPVRPLTVDLRELEGLPDPVRRYFRAALEEGQPMVAGAHVLHTGTFKVGGSTDGWRPFTSDQKVVARRPGFDWDGRVAVAPGVPVMVHDAYVAGEGILKASVVGLVPVAGMRGAGEVAEGELMRYLAEAAWYPTALLPSQGVRWEGVDDRSARATLADGGVSVTMLFVFDERGLVESVGTEARGRMVGGTVVPTPWRGRFWNYAERGGMRVPLDGEVSWLPPEGEMPYWRGHIQEIRHEFAGDPDVRQQARFEKHRDRPAGVRAGRSPMARPGKRLSRWFYRGGRPNRVARLLNRAGAATYALGIFPDRLVTLEVPGRRSGRTVSLPLVMAVVDGERYLVSMLGDGVNWVRNVRAAGGHAVLRHGRREEVSLGEIPPGERAPVLKAYLKRAPGARAHLPVDKDAPLGEFERVAYRFPVFRVMPRSDA